MILSIFPYTAILRCHLSSSASRLAPLNDAKWLRVAATAAARQSCSLGLDVSVSRPSRDVFFKRLGLVSVSGHKVSFTSGHLSKFFSFFYIRTVVQLDCICLMMILFATLRPLALQLFSAPCSSAASERVFSQSGLIRDPPDLVCHQAGWQSLCFLSATSMQIAAM